MLIPLSELPYYAVIFTSVLKPDHPGYHEMAGHIEALSKQGQGYLGMDSARSEIGISVSYWKTEADILRWKQQTDHLLAQKLGKEKWYECYTVRICKVERQYDYSS